MDTATHCWRAESLTDEMIQAGVTGETVPSGEQADQILLVIAGRLAAFSSLHTLTLGQQIAVRRRQAAPL